MTRAQSDRHRALREKFARGPDNWQGYAIALLCTVLAIPATLAIGGVQDRPFMEFFFIAVLLSTWNGGWKPGLMATVITSVSGAYLVFPPVASLAIENTVDALHLTGYVAACLFVNWIGAQTGPRRRSGRVEQRGEQQLRLALKSANAWTWEWDIQSGEVRRAGEIGASFGNPTHDRETLEETLANIHPDDRTLVRQALQDAIENCTEFDVQMRMRQDEGRYRWISTRGQTIYDIDGKPVRALGINMDITERKQAREERTKLLEREQKSRALLEAVLGSLAEGVIYVDAQDRISYVNEAAEKTLGYRLEEVKERPLHELLHPPGTDNECEAADCDLRSGVGSGASFECEHDIFQRADGGQIEVEYTGAPVTVEDEVVGAVVSFRDITQRRLTEEALQTNEKQASKGRLAATASHEINNPLEAVTNILYLLRHNPSLDGTAREHVNIAQQEIDRITQIVKNTLGAYREQAHPVAVDLRQILDNVLFLYERKARAKALKVEKDYLTDARVTATPGEIRQVLANLIINAVDASVHEGSIKVRVRKSRDWANGNARNGVRVAVGDNGSGITEENLQRLFAPFFTTKGEKGTGLGLWVSRGIVKKHGGSIRVRSSVRPGRSGTVFSVFLPMEQAVAAPQAPDVHEPGAPEINENETMAA